MGKIIAVWGSPSSGKTTFSIKLAKEISREKSVIIVSTDIICPIIPTIVDNVDSKKSIGNVLSSAQLTKEEILKNCISIDNAKNVCIIGYTEYENIFSYPQYVRSRAIELIKLLKTLADYVIIDLSSNFTVDLLSTTALEISDEVIRMTSSNLKDVSYFNSHLPLLSDGKFSSDRHINILSKVKSYDAVEELKELYKIQEIFEYNDEIREQSLCNELFYSLSTKEESNLRIKLRNIIDIIDPKEVEIENKPVKTNLFKNIFKKGKVKYESIG